MSAAAAPASASASVSAKKPRAKRQASVGLAKNELIERYGAFGDAQADASAEEARQVREKVAKWETPAQAVPSAAATAPDEFARNYEALFGCPLPPSPVRSAPAAMDLGPTLMRCVEGTFFSGSKVTAALKRDTALFSAQCKALGDALFARVNGLCPQLSAFHAALRQQLELTNVAVRSGERWQDACQPEGVLVPADAGYRVLTLPASNAVVVVPRTVAHLLGVCHAVYHVVAYMRTAICAATSDELQARVLGQPLPVVWAALCGGEPWATQTAVAEWRWEGSPPFVQAVVQLRAVLDAAGVWTRIKEPALH